MKDLAEIHKEGMKFAIRLIKNGMANGLTAEESLEIVEKTIEEVTV
jgi:hypothetical protein